MPPIRTAPKRATRQLTLTGKPSPAASSSSKSSSKSSTDRVYTDAVLPIKPEFVEKIHARSKNHEYRKYRMRDTVERIWLYATAPVSAITHVMLTGPPKIPGEVCDSSGEGNKEFDKGLKVSKFGYPVLGLYRLRTRLDHSAMKVYDLSRPQGLIYASKKLVEGVPVEDMEKVF